MTTIPTQKKGEKTVDISSFGDVVWLGLSGDTGLAGDVHGRAFGSRGLSGNTMSGRAADQTDFGASYWRIDAAVPDTIEPSATTEADEAAFRLLADNIPTLCWIAHGEGYIFWYNRRWHDYCGTTPAQMKGWGWK